MQVRALFTLPLLVLYLNAAGVAQHSDSEGRHAVSEELVEEAFETVLRSTEAARITLAAIPRAGFDREALLAEVGTQPAALFEYVRDKTRWVPYRGALRGPRGTQMEGLGNALDRALLLADLLEGAGHRVRLAHGSIPPERAESLWAELAARADRDLQRPATRVAPISSAARRRAAAALGYDDAAMARADRTANLSAQEQREDAMGRIFPQVTHLAALVEGPAGEAADRRRARDLELLHDHWWVQLESGGEWLDLDPASPAHAPGDALAVADETFTAESLPEDLEHRLRVELKVERLPRSMLGEVVYLEIAPIGRSSGGPADRSTGDVLSEQDEWLPVFTIGERTVVQSSFRLTGEVVTTPVLDTGLRKVDRISSMFDSMGTTGSDSILSRVWIDYTILAPGHQRSIERVVYDLLDLDQRATGKAPSAPELGQQERVQRAFTLLHRAKILPLVSRLSPEWVSKRMLENALSNRLPSLAIAQALGKKDPDGIRKGLGAWQHAPVTLYNLALARDAWSLGGRSLFLEGINVLTSHAQLRLGEEGETRLQLATDIVANRVAPRPFAPGDVWRARLAQGVVDTNAEALALTGAGSPVRNNAAEDLRIDLAQGVEWAVFREPRGAEWEAAEWSSADRERIASELDAGNLVVAPRRPGERGLTYWRIDPQTGSTLGLDSRGWGSADKEYLIALRNLPLRVQIWIMENRVHLTWICMACAAGRRLLTMAIPGIPFEALAMPCMALCISAGLGGGWI
jgi:hypothetical protein